MKRPHKHRRFWALLLLGLLLLGLLLRRQVDPLTEELALASISDIASNVINQAVQEQLEDESVSYSTLVQLERDSDGSITALTTNMQEMNRFKTGLLTRLDEDVTQIDPDEVSIPLGNLTGIQLLSGRGPSIPVKILSLSSSDAEFQGEFSDAGINQTLHRITLTVSLDLLILLPSGTVTDHVTTRVPVAETVLLGPVPESYTYFYSGTESDAKYIVENEG
jgi:sporulation protein YunB